MDILCYLVMTIVVLVLALSAWVVMTHGFSNRFIYTNKRNKHVTLHLSIFRTPRGDGAAGEVVSSLVKCLQKLKGEGYVSVTFETHLIDRKKIKLVHLIAKKYNFKVIDVSFFPTPCWHKLFIPFSMAFFRFKCVHVNPFSTKLTIIL